MTSTLRIVRKHGKAADSYPFLAANACRAAGVDVQAGTLKPRELARVDIWHIDWPEHLVVRHSTASTWARLARLAVTMVMARIGGVRIVWTVHNLRAHDSRQSMAASAAVDAVALLCSATVHLSHASREHAFRRFPWLRRRPNAVIPHGHYRDVYHNSLSREEVRARLGIPADAVVIALVGWIRPYKGLEALVDAFTATDDDNVVLLIAGEPKDAGVDRQLREASARDCRIVYVPGHVPAQEMGDLISATDLGVLPFRRVLNSGSAFLFLSLDRPILVPDLPQFLEIRDQVGQAWVRTFNASLEPEDIIDAAHASPLSGRPDLEANAWNHVGEMHADFYRGIAQRPVVRQHPRSRLP